ncbi:MAG: hypothetical protein QOE38_281 [Thermoleophilaceae bacterium]|nr:hypothetical protein [Thermoleophilaceae bacterium]
MKGPHIALAAAVGGMLLVPAAPLADEPPAPPTAALDAASTTVAAGTSIKLDSSGSRAGTGAIVGHVWDLDGNGSFETDSGAAPTVDATPTKPGPLTVHVRVVDDRGLSSDAQLALTVTGAPKMVAADKTIAKSAEAAPPAPGHGQPLTQAPADGSAANAPAAAADPPAPPAAAPPAAAPPTSAAPAGPAPAGPPPPAAPADPPAPQPTGTELVRMSAAPDLVPRKLLATGDTYAVAAKSATGTTVTAAAASTGVTIKNFAFAPASTSIHVGDTITWTNQDVTAHTATASDGSFDTGNINQGKSGSHTFTKAGTFAYICSIHPSMHGTVVVAAATGGSGSGGSGSSGSGGTTTTPSSNSGSSLPQTGLDIAVVVLLAALMMAAGTALRRTVH